LVAIRFHSRARATAAQVATPDAITVDALLPRARLMSAWQADDRVAGGVQVPFEQVNVSKVLSLSQETWHVAASPVAVHVPVTSAFSAVPPYASSREQLVLAAVEPEELSVPVASPVVALAVASPLVLVALVVALAVASPLVWVAVAEAVVESAVVGSVEVDFGAHERAAVDNHDNPAEVLVHTYTLVPTKPSGQVTVQLAPAATAVHFAVTDETVAPVTVAVTVPGQVGAVVPVVAEEPVVVPVVVAAAVREMHVCAVVVDATQVELVDPAVQTYVVAVPVDPSGHFVEHVDPTVTAVEQYPTTCVAAPSSVAEPITVPGQFV